MDVDKYIETVEKARQVFQASAIAKRDRGDSSAAVQHDQIASGLSDVIAFLNNQGRMVAPLPSGVGDLSDLPEELLEELSVPQADELEKKLHAVIVAIGGEAHIDQVLIGLYRRFNLIEKRRFIQNKLYRMAGKGLIYSVPKKRGTYCVEPIEDSKEEPDEEPDFDDEIPF